MQNLTGNIFHVFVLLWIFQLSCKLTHSYRYEPNTLTLQNFTECVGDEKNLVHANFSIDQIARNKCKINGELIFDAYYTGPLEVHILAVSKFIMWNGMQCEWKYFTLEFSFHLLQLQIIAKQCDYNMTHCIHFDTIDVRDICKLMKMENQLWSEFISHSEPRIGCPFKKGTIKITNGVVDMGYLAHFPLDGYTWNFVMNTFKSAHGRQRKRLLFCITFEIIVTKLRSKSRKN